jgi:hypothetical protein
MAVEHVTRTMAIDNLVINVSAWRYTCDKCAVREAFHDDPRPYGVSEATAQQRGWRIVYGPGDGEPACHCPGRAR